MMANSSALVQRQRRSQVRKQASWTMARSAISGLVLDDGESPLANAVCGESSLIFRQTRSLSTKELRRP